MGRASDTKRRCLKIVAVLLVFVLLISTALLLVDLWEKRQGLFPKQDFVETEPSIMYNGQEYVANKNIETLLVMGLDKFESDISDEGAYYNDMKADFMMLLVFDEKNESYSAVHINRDTMAEMNVLGVAGQKVGTVKKQITLAHTYGNGREVSCRNVSDAVSDLLLGVKVDHYLSLTMDSVPIFNDLVGGVEVEILDDFTGIDDTLVKGETITLMGDHALNYIRDRKGLEDSSNNRRMERQRQYLNALRDKTMAKIEADDKFVIEAVTKMSDYLVSNHTATQLQILLEKVSTYDFGDIATIDGETVKGEEFMEFYPDEESIKKIVAEMIYTPKDS